jgi:hypothetical protein
MHASPFTSLTPTQQAQATRIFQDAFFGSDPNAYDYAIETATGQLTGQRCRVDAYVKKIQHGKRSPLYVSTSGQLVLSDQNAQVFASLLLPVLLKSQDAPPVPDMDALPVAAPSLRLSGWEQGGWYE